MKLHCQDWKVAKTDPKLLSFTVIFGQMVQKNENEKNEKKIENFNRFNR